MNSKPQQHLQDPFLKPPKDLKRSGRSNRGNSQSDQDLWDKLKKGEHIERSSHQEMKLQAFKTSIGLSIRFDCILSSVANYKKEDNTLVLDDDVYYCMSSGRAP